MLTKFRNYLTTVVLLSLLSLLAGCTVKPTLSPEEVHKLTPIALVETYYKSLAREDYVTAKLCLSADLRKDTEQAEESDFNNLKELAKVVVKEVIDTKNYDSNYDEKMVAVDYHARYKKGGSSSDGLQKRYVYVAKKNSNSPWKIINIGSGP
jgi:hypothetical protein